MTTRMLLFQPDSASFLQSVCELQSYTTRFTWGSILQAHVFNYTCA